MDMIFSFVSENSVYLKRVAAFICGVALMHLVLTRTMKRRAEEK